MLIRFNRRRVVTIFPECTFALFSPVVFLRRTAGDELHGLGNLPFATIQNQQVYVIGGDDVIEHTKPITFSGFE